MSNKNNKVYSRNYRLMAVHNDLFLLTRNRSKSLEGSIPLQRVIVKALNFLKRTTQFVMLENLNKLAERHDVIKGYIDSINEEVCEPCEAYQKVMTFILQHDGMDGIVWDNKADEFRELIADAFRELRKYLSLTGIRESAHLVSLTRQLDLEEQNRVEAFGTFNALCEKSTQRALVNHIPKLVKSKKSKMSLSKGFKDLFERINKHVTDRINYE